MESRDGVVSILKNISFLMKQFKNKNILFLIRQTDRESTLVNCKNNVNKPTRIKTQIIILVISEMMILHFVNLVGGTDGF